MKVKFWLAPLAAVTITLFSSNASAVIYNFISLTQDNPGGLGESAWSTLNVGNMHITGHAGNDDDQRQFAYLDWGNAGLGVCKDVTNNSLIDVSTTGNTTNRCNPSNDDNVTNEEYLDFVFDQDVTVDNLWFNNNHDGGFGMGDMVTIAGMAYGVSTGYAGGANGIGSFFVAAGDTLRVAYNNEQFYISGIEVNAVPVPAALWLFGTALAGLIGFGKRRRAA